MNPNDLKELRFQLDRNVACWKTHTISVKERSYLSGRRLITIDCAGNELDKYLAADTESKYEIEAWTGRTMANHQRDEAKALYHHPDPVGPANDETLQRLATDLDIGLVMVAWGQHGALHNRGLIVLERLDSWGVSF